MTNLGVSTGEVKRFSGSRLGRPAHLLFQLTRRDFKSRFTGSALGVAWAVIQPLSFVALYWFVFTEMIPRSPDAGSVDYPLFLISGLLPWLGLQEGIMRGTTSILENGAMVRRLPLESEVLVVVPNASAMIFELIGLVLFIGWLVVQGSPLHGLWLLPAALLFQAMIQVGASWILATVHVFFRDVTHIIGFALVIGFYLSPILYSAEGTKYETMFSWNPMTPLLGLFRSAVLAEPLPRIGSFVLLLVFTTAVFFGGLLFFRRARPAFTDLI